MMIIIIIINIIIIIINIIIIIINIIIIIIIMCVVEVPVVSEEQDKKTKGDYEDDQDEIVDLQVMSGQQESWSKWRQQTSSTQQCLIRLIMMMEILC